MKKIILVLFILAFSSLAVASDKTVVFSLSTLSVGLGITDTMLTWHGTQHHGLIEKNKLFAPFFERGRPIDYFAVLNIQLAMSVAIVVLSNILISQDSKSAKIAGYAILVTTVVLRSYVCIRNARLNARAH